jgi:hypothetical protein
MPVAADRMFMTVPAPDKFAIRFSKHPAGLRAEVSGEQSLENTVAYWTQLLVEVQRSGPRAILLIDELQGPPLSAEQWHGLVEQMRGRGLEQVRIAHVKPRGLQLVEHCEIYAHEAGLDSRVFSDEIQADLWLRHGERG